MTDASASGLLEVWPVKGRTEVKRFIELPWVLHGDEPLWAPPLASFERWRLNRRRNPFFLDGGDAALFLARRLGTVVGRITAHIAQPGDTAGWFGFFDVADDADATAALVDAARRWLAERGCTSMTGPASFTAATEAGVLVHGGEVAGVTGRQWHPERYAGDLAAAGLTAAGDQRRFRLDPAAAGRGAVALDQIGGRSMLPSHTGPYGDQRLVLKGDAGTVAAVPDLAPALREPGVRGTAALAHRARRADWEGCTVVLCDGDPTALVPALCRAAATAGYRWVIAPWAPDDRPPETIHRLFTANLTQ